MKKESKFRKLVATISMITLIDTPILLAQQTDKVQPKDQEYDSDGGDEKVARNAQGIANKVIGFMQSDAQFQASLAAKTKLQSTMQQLDPSCLQNGQPCHQISAKYFPECRITSSITAFPQYVCEGVSPTDTGIETFKQYRDLGTRWVNQFEQMLNPAQNSQIPIGLKCIEDKKAALAQQLKNTMNSLTALQTQINEANLAFKAGSKNILDDIEANHNLLFGGGNQTMTDKTRKYTDIISPTCQNIFSVGKLQQASVSNNFGLNGILNVMAEPDLKAKNFTQNKNSYKQDIFNALEKVKQKVNSEGLESALNGSTLSDLSKYKSLGSVFDKLKVDLVGNATRIKNQLKEIQPNYNLPAMDNTFSDETQDFLAGAKDHFRKQYINDCVTGADRGVAIPLEKVLSSLSQKATKNGGLAREKYKTALKNIMESDLPIDEKLRQIKDLDKTFSGITVTYQDDKAIRVTKSPYELYMDTVKSCEQRFSSSEAADSGSGTKNTSQQKKVERAVALIKEYKQLNDTFTSKFVQSVNEKILSCNGEQKKAGQNCEASLDASSEGFCLSHAEQCANETVNCTDELRKTTKKIGDQINTAALAYNNRAMAHQKNMEALFNKQKQSVQGLVSYMQQRFPGTQFELPKDLAVLMPEASNSKFGVKLIGGGDFKYMEEYPNKIEKLKELIASQGDDTNRLMSEYIDSQKQAMENQKKRWEGIAQKCGDLFKQSVAAKNDMESKMAQQQAEAQAAAGQFCKRFGRLKQNPVPTCSKNLTSMIESLDKAAGAVAYVNDNAYNSMSDLAELCEDAQSELNEAKDSLKDEERDLNNLCSADMTDEELLKRLGEYGVNNLETEKNSSPSQEDTSTTATTDTENSQREEKKKSLNERKAKITKSMKSLEVKIDSEKPSEEVASSLRIEYTEQANRLRIIENELNNLAQISSAEPSTKSQDSTKKYNSNLLIKIDGEKKTLADWIKNNPEKLVKQGKKDTLNFLKTLGDKLKNGGLNNNLCYALATKKENGVTPESTPYANINENLKKPMTKAFKTAQASKSSNPSSASDHLVKIGQSMKAIECEAGRNSDRDMFKGLFEAPASLQALGVGGTGM